MPQFHDTLMGRKFYESIMPSIARSLVSIANSLKDKKKDEAVGKAADDRLKEVTVLLKEGVDTDGAHHKQWYLEQIAVALKVELPEHEEGIAP